MPLYFVDRIACRLHSPGAGIMKRRRAANRRAANKRYVYSQPYDSQPYVGIMATSTIGVAMNSQT